MAGEREQPGIVAQSAGVPHTVVDRERRAVVGEFGDVLPHFVVETQFVLFRHERDAGGGELLRRTDERAA